MFLEGLDELDQKIVQLLIKNARMSYSEIGSLVGISRVAVKMYSSRWKNGASSKSIPPLSIPRRSAEPYPATLRLRQARTHLPGNRDTAPE